MNYKYKSLPDFRKANPNLYLQLYNRGELNKLCLDMNWEYNPKQYDSPPYASEQEHKEFILQHKLTSGYKYGKVYKISKLKLHSHPDKLFGYATEKEFFDSIRQQMK